MERLSQNIERVRYRLSRDELRAAICEYMDNRHNIVLPSAWTTEDQHDGMATIVADYIIE